MIFSFEVKATSREEILIQLATNVGLSVKKNLTCIFYLYFLCSTTCMNIARKVFVGNLSALQLPVFVSRHLTLCCKLQARGH